MSNPTIFIEGNIGAGKSTFLEVLNEDKGLLGRTTQIIREPLDIWQNLKGINYLRLYYTNPKKYGFL